MLFLTLVQCVSKHISSVNWAALTDAILDATDEVFLSTVSSSRRPFPVGGSGVLTNGPALCLVAPPATRFGELLLNGRRLLGNGADGDNNR